MANSDEPFLQRWSRRKVEARHAPETGAPEPTSDAIDETATPARAQDAEGTREGEAPRELTEQDFADVDFEKLDMSSDYAPFMQKGVPEAIRQKALRQLWSSDPVFSAIEPFNEYGGDFTDKAVAVAPGTLQTAWRIGKGFLSDDEVAAWEKLGKPEVAEEVADAASDAAPVVASEAAAIADTQPLPPEAQGDATMTEAPADAAPGSAGAQLAEHVSETAHDGAQASNTAPAPEREPPAT